MIGPIHSTYTHHVSFYCRDATWRHKYYRHRANIRNFHPEFLVTADSWPYFLYKKERYDSNKPTKGLFKNKLLVWVGFDILLMMVWLIVLQAFKYIFTSPGSANSGDTVEDSDTDTEPPPKRQRGTSEKRTRSHVATLIGMKSVSPRAIAYAAVQVSIVRSMWARLYW